MKTATEILFDPTIYGHSLVKPVQWYGRHMAQIFTKSFPKETFFAAVEVLARIVAFVALVVLSPTLIVTSPVALVGWAIKYYSQPIPQPPALEAPPRSPAPQPTSFVPFTAEKVEAAQKKATELTALYNGLKELSESNAQKLFNGIAEFRSLYEKHRDPDPFNVSNMTKIFNIIDEIATHTSGMRVALQHWYNFYQVQADVQGVVPQPKDGNCWLHTSILGLQHINHPSLNDDTHLTLRPKVVEWMCTNYETDENLRRFITDAIEAHQAVETQRLQEERNSLNVAIAENLILPEETEQAKATLEGYGKLLEGLESFSLNNYFTHMRKVGSHGTHAELYAISRMYQVNMAIWRDIPSRGNLPNRLTKEYDEQIRYPGAEYTVNAVLTQEGNHFNYRLPQSMNLSQY